MNGHGATLSLRNDLYLAEQTRKNIYAMFYNRRTVFVKISRYNGVAAGLLPGLCGWIELNLKLSSCVLVREPGA